MGVSVARAPPSRSVPHGRNPKTSTNSAVLRDVANAPFEDRLALPKADIHSAKTAVEIIPPLQAAEEPFSVTFDGRSLVGEIKEPLSRRHHPDLTVTRLMADIRLPLAWTEQRQMLAAG